MEDSWTEVKISNCVGPMVKATVIPAHVTLPAKFVTENADHAFRSDYEGKHYYWTGDQAEIEGDVATFYLKDAKAVTSPDYD